jgi:transglutaminase-like putative cysteine protease
MDFHAVAEAYLDGAWYVIDATRLANRRSLVRIATGRDAADCAFLSYHGGYVGLERLRVDAWVVPEAATLEGLDTLPDALPEAADPASDDFGALVQIS